MPNHRADRVAARLATSPLIENLERRMLLSVDVLTGHNDQARTGLNQNETILTPTTVHQSLTKLSSYPVDGQIYAQPLYVSNLNIPGRGTHNVVFVATEHDSVYAFDANGGGQLWHVSLGTSASVPNNDFGNRYGPYHDIDPEVGITGTPVIDLSSGTMYVDAFTHDGPGQYSHHVHALSITSGADEVTPALVAASYPGNGVGGNVFTAQQQLQRPALTLLNGVLYVSYGGYADTDPYHGWILGFNASNLRLVSVFNSTPNLLSGNPSGGNAGEGAVWQSGAGLSSDGSSLYAVTGNGDFNSAIGDYGDSVLKLSTSLGVQQSFTPFNQASLSAFDEDLGSGGSLLLPDSVGSAAHPHLMVVTGKQGLIYLIDRDNLGGFHSNFDNVVQEVNLGQGTWSNPAYFDGTLYYHAQNDVLKAFNVSNGQLTSHPVSAGVFSYGFPGATPSISSNGNSNGIVWEIQQDPNHAVLRAYDANNLTNLLYSSSAASHDQLGPGVKFAVPTIADGQVFVGTSNALAIFGIKSSGGGGESPFHGVPFNISTDTIQAEDFDNGGEGVAYHAVPPQQVTGLYRNTTLSIVNGRTGTYSVGSTNPGEWIKYTINAPSSGAYVLQVRVANAAPGAAIHAEIDGINVTGAISIPPTSSWFTYETLTSAAFNVSAGVHVLRIFVDKGDTWGTAGDFDYFRFQPASSGGETPFGGTPFNVSSGVLQAENFDNGGEGVAYHAVPPQHVTRLYRNTTLSIVDGHTGTYSVGYTGAGEWLKYTIDVPTSGTYALQARVANAAPGAALHGEIDGINVTGTMSIPPTASWFTYETVTSGSFHLSAGTHVLRIFMERGDTWGAVGDFDWFNFVAA